MDVKPSERHPRARRGDSSGDLDALPTDMPPADLDEFALKRVDLFGMRRGPFLALRPDGHRRTENSCHGGCCSIGWPPRSDGVASAGPRDRRRSRLRNCGQPRISASWATSKNSSPFSASPVTNRVFDFGEIEKNGFNLRHRTGRRSQLADRHAPLGVLRPFAGLGQAEENPPTNDLLRLAEA